MIMTEKMEIEIENIEDILSDTTLTESEKLKYIAETIKKIRS